MKYPEIYFEQIKFLNDARERLQNAQTALKDAEQELSFAEKNFDNSKAAFDKINRSIFGNKEPKKETVEPIHGVGIHNMSGDDLVVKE